MPAPGSSLDAIAAVAIGGTSLVGGRGSLAGALCGVIIFGMLSNILQLHNINSNIQLVLKGLIIVGTVLRTGTVWCRDRHPVRVDLARPKSQGRGKAA
jgi:ribose/xylose/arabinose/galactoside ABC-type transport system permease subunit